MQKIYDKINSLGKQYDASKILLFGSRARGDNRERSDIDIAVFGMPEQNRALFEDDVQNLPTLLDFDVIFVTEHTDTMLVENIKKDGRVIMDKLNEKLNKFSSAVEKLSQALDEYEEYGITSSRDGVIQRFEFCTELAWKSAREYLLEQGYTQINSPKSVMKQAYADGLIDNETDWIELINARNLTSHIYDEKTAGDIYESIKTKYVRLFVSLTDKLKQ